MGWNLIRGIKKIKSLLVNSDGTNVDVQHPLPTDGDTVYKKDINLDVSDNFNFSGLPADFFNSLITVQSDVTANNPKQLKFWFNRTVYASAIGLGCNDLGQSFSNIKVMLLGSGEVVRHTIDLSADSTKLNSKLIQFAPSAFNGFLIEFLTVDPVGLSNITVRKEIKVDAQLEALKASGEVVHINASKSGNLQITDAEGGLAIAKGEVAGTGFIAKFGNAHDFDTSDGFVNIWDGADDANTNIMQYTYSTVTDINRISSSDNGDTQQVTITGLDENWVEVTQIITLTGQTPVLLPTVLIRCYRMKNIGATELAGFVYCYTSAAAVSAGVPAPSTTVRAIIENGEGQTLMAMVPIPANRMGYLNSWYFSASGARRDSTHVMKLRVREFGGVFVTKHVQAISFAGSSSIEHNYKIPLPYPEKTDIEMIANTDENQAGVSGGFDLVLVDN